VSAPTVVDSKINAAGSVKCGDCYLDLWASPIQSLFKCPLFAERRDRDMARYCTKFVSKVGKKTDLGDRKALGLRVSTVRVSAAMSSDPDVCANLFNLLRFFLGLGTGFLCGYLIARLRKTP
jgi:hypothetical protein